MGMNNGCGCGCGHKGMHGMRGRTEMKESFHEESNTKEKLEEYREDLKAELEFLNKRIAELSEDDSSEKEDSD
ncbi:MAG: DUF5320 domain-containing protein [Candidatus Parvarchaeum sp.]